MRLLRIEPRVKLLKPLEQSEVIDETTGTQQRELRTKQYISVRAVVEVAQVLTAGSMKGHTGGVV